MAIETLLKRDQSIVVAAILVLTALAWIYLLWLARTMALAGMPDMPGTSGMVPMIRPWTAGDLGFTFAMWAIMMVGMMTPSAAPMVLIYARVARQSASDGKPLAATGWFAGGYLLSWTVFSLIAAMAQGVLERAAWLTPMMAATNNKVGGALLIVAGVYQCTPLKDSCLTQCQSPFRFIQAHGGFSRSIAGSIQLGLRHGLYCIGCCWALMVLLFAGGVMNVAWIAAIAVFVLIEKAIPAGRIIARVAGVGLIAGGLWLLVRG